MGYIKVFARRRRLQQQQRSSDHNSTTVGLCRRNKRAKMNKLKMLSKKNAEGEICGVC